MFDRNSPAHREYVAQIEAMAERVKAWHKKNPAREILVSFNFPDNVWVAVPISEAVERGLVSTNDTGMEVLKAIWPWDDRSEPTVMMVRIALDVAMK